MSRIQTLHKLAEANAAEIAVFLKNEFAGETVTKSSIRTQFKLPHNRSVIVWEYLRTYGIEVEHNALIVPSSEQK